MDVSQYEMWESSEMMDQSLQRTLSQVLDRCCEEGESG